jgi:hypothetical protein
MPYIKRRSIDKEKNTHGFLNIGSNPKSMVEIDRSTRPDTTAFLRPIFYRKFPTIAENIKAAISKLL